MVDRLCQKAPADPAGEQRLIWGAISSSCSLTCLEVRVPGIKKGIDTRSDRIRKSVEDADNAKYASREQLRSTAAESPTRRTSPARIVEEARQQADALKREREAALQAELAGMREGSLDIEASKAQAVADLGAEVARLAMGASGEVVVQHNLDASTQTQLVGELHQPGRGEGAARRPHQRLRHRPLRGGRRAEGFLDEVEDSSSASLAPSRAVTSCATCSSTRPSPRCAARRSSRSCSAARPRASRPRGRDQDGRARD